MPVLLVCSHPKRGEAWWAHIQSYFADPARRASGRVDFNKITMSLEGDVSDRLFAVADPHGRAHTPVADLRDETLESNLLPVTMPDVFWAYDAAVTLPRKVYDLQRESSLDIRDDFTLFGGRLLTWSPVEDTALAGAVNGDPTIEATGELLDGSPDSERVLVRLLNNAFRQDLRDDCAFHGKRHMLYFRATDDLSPRSWNTSGTHWRSVFKPHAKKTNPSQVSYYKHAGLKWQFLNLDDDWFCALTPDYYYSIDGYRESRFTAQYLSGIKRLERNPAVLGETRMWAAILAGREGGHDSLFSQNERILDFGKLVTFDTDRGIDEAKWSERQRRRTRPILWLTGSWRRRHETHVHRRTGPGIRQRQPPHRPT
ncbi:DUF4365 domain-containing protein [Pimelobacter simplex]|uniref:DUF4365 domain-containing protein n=1 Tax=Nocardioides simplex TaxID=2045 RepID=A0A7J5DQ97_NOCSI|nr:DUF4365 domain-containing protein [Pimelobacter simplex]KAB2805361.1 DUF4365 domain-containing protein [Pimelobacter simplex]